MNSVNMKKFLPFSIFILLAFISAVYIYPIFSGLILLPLDLLVSNSNPWHLAGTILLKNPYMQDSIIQMFPWRHMTFDALTHGVFPLWNPYQFMGMPFMAGMKPMVFYPANLLFLLGEVKAWNALLWLQLFLSVYFSYLFARSLRLSVMVSIFAGISFGFNSLMVSVLEFGSEGHVLLWLPALLYSTKQFFTHRTVRYLFGISIAASCSIFAGHLQYFAYIALILFAFAYYESGINGSKKKDIIPVIISLFIGVGIAAIQIVPGIELFNLSYRGLADNYGVFSNGLLQPYHLLRLLSPDWFGNPVTRDLTGGYIESSGYLGIIPLFFACYALITQRKQVYVKFFGLATVFSLLFSMNGIGQILYYLHIPLITSGFGGRFFSIALFSLSVCAAFGLQNFIQEESNRKKVLYVIFYTVIICVLFAIGLAFHSYGITTWVALSNIKIQIFLTICLCIGSLLYIRFYKSHALVQVFFILFVISATYMDLFRMGYRFLTFSNTKFLYESTAAVEYIQEQSRHSLARSFGISEPEIYGVFKLYSPETYNPLYPLRTAKLLQSLEHNSDLPLPINKYYLTKNSHTKHTMDFLGVKYIAPGKGKNPATEVWNDSSFESQLEKVYEDTQHDIYVNKGALPRFGLYYDVIANVSDEDALTAIANNSIDFTKQLLISSAFDVDVREGTGSVTMQSSDMNSMTFAVESSSPGVLYISDTFFPGWHATVNNGRVPIHRANYNFRAVGVPSGRSTVSMWYMPDSVIYGGVISIFSLIILLPFLIYYHRKTHSI